MSSSNLNSTVSSDSSDSSLYPEDVITQPPKIPHPDRPNNPDFSFLEDNSKNMILSGYLSMNKKEGWDILVNFNEDAFLFCKNPSILVLMDSINDNYDGGHSGASLAWTMRQLEYIAKYGYTQYRISFLE